MKPHDQFAKNYLEQLLSPLGIVEISKEVSDETRQIDLFFSPNPEPNPDYLGLLGRIVLNTVLIEPYRNPPNRSEIRNCLAKLLRFFRTYNVENSPSSLSVQQCSKVDKYQSNKNSKPYYTSFTSISC